MEDVFLEIVNLGPQILDLLDETWFIWIIVVDLSCKIEGLSCLIYGLDMSLSGLFHVSGINLRWDIFSNILVV